MVVLAFVNRTKVTIAQHISRRFVDAKDD